MFILLGCQDHAEVDKPQVEEPVKEEANQTESENEFNREPEQVSEETIVGEIEKTPEEPALNPVISLEEAKVITKENLAKSVELMQELQEEYPDWYGLDEQSEDYKNGVEATKEQLANQISESEIDQWAATYFEEFFMYNHLYEVLHPGGMNTRFELKEFTEEKFTLSYIQLGDEAFAETIKYDVIFLKENEEWKFAGYSSEKVRESLELTEKDLTNAFINYETLERLDGELVEKIIYNGETFLVMDYGDYKRAINSSTGEESSFLLDELDY